MVARAKHPHHRVHAKPQKLLFLVKTGLNAIVYFSNFLMGETRGKTEVAKEHERV
jgi:hypothetical protein